MLVSKSQENIYITTSYHTVFQRAVLDFAPLCNEWQIKTAMMSMHYATLGHGQICEMPAIQH